VADTITFGPLSVLPKYHRRGIGAALVRNSIEKAREMGFSAIIIVGVPEYYPKLGFRRGVEFDLAMADGSVIDAFMAYEIVPGYLDGGGIYNEYAPKFDIVEKDIEAQSAFHRQFMTKYFPNMLTLRPLFDGDVDLVEKWIYTEHVAPWYEHPEDWMHEIRSRHDEFSFLNHMIAEYNGCPIGFCQYYDCFDAKEEWYTAEFPGEMYSIDYMIGNTEYLRRGFGKEIIGKLVEIIWKIGAKTIIVNPDKENAASCRSLLANGFTYTENNGEPVYILSKAGKI